ncbi:hypothetical protein ACTXT7_017623 [Hymenolepis weldensis]
MALWGADLTEIPTVMHEHKVSSNSDANRVNLDADVDADVYVETVQTIVVKPPWTGSAANGGRPPYIFQQDSASSHKALNSHDWKDGWIDGWLRSFIIMSHHTKLMTVS